MWNEGGYDALVLPVASLPATINGKTGDVNCLFSTCFLPNYYDLPAGVVPIRLVKESEQHHQP